MIFLHNSFYKPMFLMKLKGKAKMILKKKLETKQSITVTESSITSYKQEGGIIKKNL